MITIEKSIKHSIGKEKALEKIHQLVPGIKDRFGNKARNLTEEWDSDQCRFSFDFKVMMFITGHISGEIRVTDDEVIIKAEGPNSIAMLKNKVEDILGSEGEKLLA